VTDRADRPRGDALPYIFLAVAPLCWAGNIVLARGVHALISPVSLAFWRWSLAFVLILPFTWKTARADWTPVVRAWKIMLLLSLLGITCFNTLLYSAMHSTTAINGALIQTTMPAVIILISLMLFRETISQRQLLGVCLCMFGAASVILQGRFDTLMQVTFVRGDAIMMLAVVLYALYTALIRQRPPIHPLSFLTYSFGIGAMGLLPIYVWELGTGGVLPLTPAALWSILYVAVFPSILAYFCWNRGIDRIGPNRAGLYVNLVPVFTAVLAVFILGESLKAFHLLGMAAIFAGMGLFYRHGGRRRAPGCRA
jgi:drug/metabolite transporter (DMT)-like permease